MKYGCIMNCLDCDGYQKPKDKCGTYLKSGEGFDGDRCYWNIAMDKDLVRIANNEKPQSFHGLEKIMKQIR